MSEKKQVEVIGVRFAEYGKAYYFNPAGREYKVGSGAIVETARGIEYGYVAIANTKIDESDLVAALRPALRPATPDDDLRNRHNKELGEQSIPIANEKIKEHKLDMKLIGAEYTFDNSKLLFSFTADNFDVYHVNDYMRRKGWRFNGQQYPNALHMCVTRPQTKPGVVDAFAVDLAEAVDYAKANAGSQAESGTIYGGVAGGMTDEADEFIRLFMADMMDKQMALPPEVQM